jgi:hypothetical protein
VFGSTITEIGELEVAIYRYIWRALAAEEVASKVQVNQKGESSAQSV